MNWLNALTKPAQIGSKIVATLANPTVGLPKGVERAVATTYETAAAFADAIDRVAQDDSSMLSPKLVPGAWATAKVGSVLAAWPVSMTALAVMAGINTARTRRRTADYPQTLSDIMDGKAVTFPARRVQRVPAGERYFISSDLHRYSAGNLDWPEMQRSKKLYDVALDYYGERDFGLIENGDIEDYWMAGGSAHGVVYDIGRALGYALALVDSNKLLASVLRNHLDHIVDNNRSTYDKVRTLFHDKGRFWRTVGNHDDCYLIEGIDHNLRSEFPDLEPCDFIVFDVDDDSVAVLCHGHQTDSWNGPGMSAIGKITTSVGTAVCDIPFTDATPGMVEPEFSEDILDGRATDHLRAVNPMLGVDSDFYSLDETLLYEAFLDRWGTKGSDDLDDGPILILGHTHVPLEEPYDPDTHGEWMRYFNSGSGITPELVTGLEWDGVEDPSSPKIRLVAWHYADEDTPDDEILGHVDGRGVVRSELVHVPAVETLEVRSGDQQPAS